MFELETLRSYVTPEEEEQRFGIFQQTLERIEQGNARNGKPVFGLNGMSDRLPSEGWKRGRQGHADLRFIHTAPVYEASANEELPAAIDWRPAAQWCTSGECF